MGKYMEPAVTKIDPRLNIDKDDALIQDPADSVFEDPSVDVAGLAYHYWEQRQRDHLPGSALEDWLRAEADLIGTRKA